MSVSITETILKYVFLTAVIIRAKKTQNSFKTPFQKGKCVIVDVDMTQTTDTKLTRIMSGFNNSLVNYVFFPWFSETISISQIKC